METTTKTLIDQLLFRRPDLGELAQDWRCIEDILAGPRAIKGLAMTDKHSQAKASTYLPRNLSEHPDEYAKRLDITPCFFETPGVLQARQGALFREPPAITLPEVLCDLEDECTAAGASLVDVAVKASELCQVNGFCGVLLDRAPLPADVAGRAVSQAEATERKLGRLILALYPAAHILDYATDARGVLWVKLLEEHHSKPTFDAEAQCIKTVRIVDRTAIRIWEITESSTGVSPVPGQAGEHGRDARATELPAVTHGFTDDDEQPAVPFVFFDPFPGRDGRGRSVLRGVAEADLAATRVLSELVWILHMTVPLLVLKTRRDEKEIGDIGLGASRFLILKSKDASEEAEDLAFAQIDVGPATVLAKTYESMVSRAKDQATKSEAVGVSGPVEQSGISKAWTFKTGEERVLHLLAQCLQRGFDKLLDMAARAAGADEDDAGIVFPDTFDVQGPETTLRDGPALLNLFAEYGLNSAAAATLEKIFAAWIRNPTQTQWDEFQAELEEVKKRNLRPGAVFTSGPGGTPGDEDGMGKMPMPQE